MAFFDRVKTAFTVLRGTQPTNTLPGQIQGMNSEVGRRSTPDSEWRQATRQLWVDPELRQTILDIRAMDLVDGRVKKIHLRTARSTVKGGLKLLASAELKKLHAEWDRFSRRLALQKREKLESDARGFMMEGNLPIQWVYSDTGEIIGAIRMPSETIVPITNPNGTFKDTAAAYQQIDLVRGNAITKFALYQLTCARLTPQNYDDWGSLGRPYLDASRTTWRRLDMTENDMTLRRKMRAPLRVVHLLEGAGAPELEAYRTGVEQDQAHGVQRDYYLNRKGSVTAMQGDANLDQIADVSYLLDTFFAGSPAPKGLFGYTDGLARDILEDMKRDYYEEIDSLQDNQAALYEQGFKIHLLLKGMNPENMEFTVQFAERRTDTPNQRADLGLKLQALGVSRESVWDAAGLDSKAELTALEAQNKLVSPYPDDGLAGPGLDEDDEPPGQKPARVNVTPSNARKGESATTISTRGT